MIALDYLTRLIQAAENKGLVEGCSLSSISISHLLFAYDILLFIRDDDGFLENYYMIIKAFEQASGLNINFEKSSISEVNVSEDRVYTVASRWGCPPQPLPISYLGTPLGAKSSNISFWNPVVEKIQRKLDNWRFSYISKGGRLTLIQSTLSSIPLYTLSVFKPPQSICKQVDMILRTFLWKGANSNDHKIPLVGWNKVAAPKVSGGLGFYKTKISNDALLSKWLWRFFNENSSLWKRLISAKYKTSGDGSIPLLSRFSSSRAPWFSIIKLLPFFEQNSSWELRNGENILFWKDAWSPFGHLVRSFPRLFAVSSRHDLKISEAWVPSSSSWDFFPRRPLLDRELDLWQNISSALPKPSSSTDKDILLCWLPHAQKCFTVASARLKLWESSSSLQVDSEVLSNLWRAPVPKKCKFFIWTIFHRSLNTDDRLQNFFKDSSLLPSRCSLCLQSSECLDHLFVRCPMAFGIWSFFFKSAGITAPIPQQADSLCAFAFAFSTTSQRRFWIQAVSVAAIWTIWNERNSRIFRNQHHTFNQILEDIITLSAS